MSSQHPPSHPLSRQTFGSSGRCGEFQFDENIRRNSYDYWIVCDGLLERETVNCPPSNVLLVTWEPPERIYSQRFLDQFAGVVTCHPDLRHPNVVLSQQGHPWHIPRTYDELRALSAPPKTKCLSVIASDKQMYEGHRVRYDFAQLLKREFGDELDMFGRGINSFDDKWEVLAPYRYSVVIENAFLPHWITEKLPDCFLTETFPFYGGAPNAADYFPEQSFLPIDVADPDVAIGLIRRTIEDQDHYASVRPHVLEARDVYLSRESLFPLLSRLLDTSFTSKAESVVASCTIEPEFLPQPLWKRPVGRLARSLSEFRR